MLKKTLNNSNKSREFHAYGVGMGLTGTHSLTAMFHQYRSQHEPRSSELMKRIISDTCCDISFVRERENALNLEMNVSFLNGFILNEIVSIFPDAVFINTVRDCTKWLESYILRRVYYYQTHRFNITTFSRWLKWESVARVRFTPEKFSYTKHDNHLKKYGLYPIKAYVEGFIAYNKKVIETVPANRLLIIKTHELGRSEGKLAEFLNIPVESIDISKSHLHVRKPIKTDAFSRIDTEYVQRLCAS